MLSSHSYRQLLLLTLSLLLFLVAPEAATACSCGPRPTVLDSYDGSDVVIITRLVSVEKRDDTEAERYVDGVRSTTMVVEKVFKGNLKVGDEIVFGQGGGADCIWTFKSEWIGDQFLFYVNTPKKNPEGSYFPSTGPGFWYAVTCGRSNGLEYATEDMLYLENMSKLRGRTRVSGRIGGGWRNLDMDVENRKVRIIGPKKTYEVKTGKHGVFEIYDLPAGKYMLEPEMPSGWKIDRYSLRSSPSVERDTDSWNDDKPVRQVPFVLEAKKHASVNVAFEIDNAVRGTVSDPEGKPMAGVCLTLLASEGKGGGGFDCSDEAGKFEIDSVPEGSYIVVANKDGKLSSSEPFKTFYYPGISERERAAVISIRAGEIVKDIDFVIPSLAETVIIEGVLRYSDGKPVAEERVGFEADKKDDVDGDAGAETDAAGRFSLRILKGLKGQISAEDWFYLGEYVNCPKLDSLIKKGGQTNLTVKTNVLTVVADNNLYNLELTYPFPRCEKAKQ